MDEGLIGHRRSTFLNFWKRWYLFEIFFVVEILLFEWLVDLLEERLIIHSYEKHNFARVRKVFPSISNIVTNQQEGLSGGSVEISKDLIGLTNLDLVASFESLEYVGRLYESWRIFSKLPLPKSTNY